MPSTKEKLEKEKEKLEKIYKQKLPLSVGFITLISAIYPYFPRKGGRMPQIEEMNYTEAFIENLILFVIILSISFYFMISEKRKKVERLEREYKIEKKNIKPYH